MTDRRTAILESIEKGDYHQAEMFIKSCFSRFGKDRRYPEIDKIIVDVLDILAKKPVSEIKDVIIQLILEWKHGY